MRVFFWRRRRTTPFLCLTFLVAFLLLSLVGLVLRNAPINVYRPNQKFDFADKRRSPINDQRLVVGYYQGNNLPWVKDNNLTDDLLNANFYSPDPSAGLLGSPVIIPPFEGPKMSTLFRINRFNLMASDRIPLNRSLPDVRREACKSQDERHLEADLPSTSIIIVFHNEAFSTLLRTVHSVLIHSPPQLIQEIILVDDASTRTFLKGELDGAVRDLKKVKILRSKERIGLVRARLVGARAAEGEVFTFLDAHCECTPGWLPPLLSHIHSHPSSIPSPVIDVIHDETFQYVRSFELHQGGFNWDLHFRWFPLPNEVVDQRQKKGNPTDPIATPVMAGGLFSIRRDLFWSLGGYDEGMNVWGGENLEISLRAWLCNSSLVILPCSHVAHLFRKSSPYSFPGGVSRTLSANLGRLAAVWLDQWSTFFFKLHPESLQFLPSSNDTSLLERKRLREKLGCKPFSWFLENVWTSHFFPVKGRFVGRIRSKLNDLCLTRPGGLVLGTPTGPPTLSSCVTDLYSPQLFVQSPEGYMRSNENVCLDAMQGEVRITACSGVKRQAWSWKMGRSELVHTASGKCLGMADKGGGLILRGCGSPRTEWDLEEVEWM